MDTILEIESKPGHSLSAPPFLTPRAKRAHGEALFALAWMRVGSWIISPYSSTSNAQGTRGHAWLDYGRRPLRLAKTLPLPSIIFSSRHPLLLSPPNPHDQTGKDGVHPQGAQDLLQGQEVQEAHRPQGHAVQGRQGLQLRAGTSTSLMEGRWESGREERWLGRSCG